MIKPGLLVAVKSSVAGGVSYRRTDLAAAPSVDAIGANVEVSTWETTRIVADAAEHDRAVKARGLAIREIGAQCARTAFGLLCPVDREADLDAALVRARQIVDAHNATATHTLIRIYMLKGRIADTDEQAARAIGAEVASLIEGMSGAIDRLDVAAIRDAATRAQAMGAMLDAGQASKVQDAIVAARKAARMIVARVEKGAEDAAIVLADIQRGAIEKARIAFLDLDEAAPAVDGPALPAVNVQRMSDLDLDETAETIRPTDGEGPAVDVQRFAEAV